MTRNPEHPTRCRPSGNKSGNAPADWHGTDERSTCTDRPIPDDLTDAVHALADRGAQFVLTRLHLGEDKPRPYWRAWPEARPSAGVVVTHLHHGGTLGIVPASVGTSALDVDEGDPARLLREFPALAELATRRGVHLYYPDDLAEHRSGGPFRSDVFEVAGDVKAGPGHLLRLDHDRDRHLVELAEQIIYGPARWFFERNPLATPATFGAVAQGVLFEARRSPAPGSRVAGMPPVAAPSVAGATPGTRNEALFRSLQDWALTREPGHSRHDWERAAEAKARELNATMADPLPDAEATATGRSVAGWRWTIPACAHAAAFRALQAERGRRGGLAGTGEAKAKSGAKGGRKGRGKAKAKGGAAARGEAKAAQGAKGGVAGTGEAKAKGGARGGAASGAARRQATAERDRVILTDRRAGLSLRAIAQRHGCSASTVRNVLRRGG